MKINVAFPATGCQKLFEINDEHKVGRRKDAFAGLEDEHASLGNRNSFLLLGARPLDWHDPLLALAFVTYSTDELNTIPLFQVRPFYEKRMGQDVDAATLGDEWKGYVLRITGGNDKQGFPMKQGVLTQSRVRLLLSKGHSCYR